MIKKEIFSGVASILIAIMLIIGCSSSSNQIWAEGKPLHHTKEGFRNFPEIPEAPPVGFAFYMRRFLGSFVFPDVPEGHVLDEEEAIMQYNSFEGKNSVTWLGHATFLIKLNGKTILTDPFLTDNASPVKYFGPQRFAKPGISLENLPMIDILVVSHNHLDHLDAETVESLHEKERIQVFVPLGLGGFFEERGYRSIIELDWYDSVEYSGINFSALPAVHYSRRGTNDKNKSLWCSWSMKSSAGSYYFSGDTQDSDVLFKEIGQRDGPYDLALMSIGAYKTRKTGQATHLTPEEAVKVSLELGVKTIVGMHWGTIELSDEPHFEPPVRFQKAASKSGYLNENVWIMKIGETKELPGQPFI